MHIYHFISLAFILCTTHLLPALLNGLLSTTKARGKRNSVFQQSEMKIPLSHVLVLILEVCCFLSHIVICSTLIISISMKTLDKYVKGHTPFFLLWHFVLSLMYFPVKKLRMNVISRRWVRKRDCRHKNPSRSISGRFFQPESCSSSNHHASKCLQSTWLPLLLTPLWTPLVHNLLSCHHAGYTQHPLGPICTAKLCESLSSRNHQPMLLSISSSFIQEPGNKEKQDKCGKIKTCGSQTITQTADV